MLSMNDLAGLTSLETLLLCSNPTRFHMPCDSPRSTVVLRIHRLLDFWRCPNRPAKQMAWLLVASDLVRRRDAGLTNDLSGNGCVENPRSLSTTDSISNTRFFFALLSFSPIKIMRPRKPHSGSSVIKRSCVQPFSRNN